MNRRAPQTTEEARAKALESYEDLINRMFGNLERDISAGLRASKALQVTGERNEDEEYSENGEYMVIMLRELGIAVDALRSRYEDKFGISEISETEWEVLDRETGD